MALNEQLLAVPEGFTVNPKLKRQLERRRTALGPEGGIDWGHAEALAFASLLTEGVPIRLTGQDTERGTFSHRHLVLHDAVTGATVTPDPAAARRARRLRGLQQPALRAGDPRLRVRLRHRRVGIPGALGGAVRRLHQRRPGHRGPVHGGRAVEVGRHQPADPAAAPRLRGRRGRSIRAPGSSGFCSWRRRGISGWPTAPPRRSTSTCCGARPRRNRVRPLVVFTPKSLLRLPQAASSLDDLTSGTFRPVHGRCRSRGAAARPASIERVVLCSGKIYYDLLAEADKLGDRRPRSSGSRDSTPSPRTTFAAVLARYPAAKEIVWAQEEPRNMGAWSYIWPR